MKIKQIRINNRKRCFEVVTAKKEYFYPYSKLDLQPGRGDRIEKVFVDKELANEGFTYVLQSGESDCVHIEQVLEFNEDPKYLTEQLVYRLTLLLQNKLKESPLSKRRIASLLGTSPAQLERLIDQTNYKKSIRQLITALHVVDCRIDFVELDEDQLEAA